MHYEGSRNSGRQQYQDQQGSGTVNSFGGHQHVQPNVPAPAPSPIYTNMPHTMPSQIPSGAQTIYNSQPQIDCYPMQTPPPPPAEVYFTTSYSHVQMQPGHVVPVAQSSVMLPTLKMSLATTTNKTIDGNKSKCCHCGSTNTFWELELANLEGQIQERDKIIFDKDSCIKEKDLKIQQLESELMRLKESPVNSVSVNDIQNDGALSTDKIVTNSKTQLSAEAPEFKFHSSVPVVSANGDISKCTKNEDSYANKKTEDSIESEDTVVPRDDDDDLNNNNNYEEQSTDLKVSTTSGSCITPSDTTPVATQEAPSYSRATKVISSDDTKRADSDRSHLGSASVKKKKFGRDRNDSIEYPETKRESTYHSGQYPCSTRVRESPRRGISNQAPQERERRPLDRKGYGRSNRENVRSSIIKEIEGDLFEASEDYSLAHCVGQDFRMGSGIAVEFRKKFKHVAELLSQKTHVGKVAYLESNGRYIFYLVTKPLSTGKPTFDSFKSAVDDLKLKCQELNVKKLAMPKIGCGLDRLNWFDVKQYLEKTFQGTDIDILVYYISQGGEREGNQSQPKLGPPTPKYASYPLLTIIDEYGRSSTGLVFFGTADGHMDVSGEKLEKRFHFADDFKKADKSEGTVVNMNKQSEHIFALIVKKTEQDEFSFLNLESCLQKLSLMLKETRYEYVAFEAFEVPTDDVIVHKVLTMFCNYLHKYVSEVWVCWPPDVVDVHGYQRKEGGNVQYSSKPNH